MLYNNFRDQNDIIKKRGKIVNLNSRILSLSSAVNFRDFGGYPTASGTGLKWGMLYRSATLSKMDDADIPIVNAIGLNRVIDLRTNREIEWEGFDRIYHHNEQIYDFLEFNYGDPYLIDAQVSNELEWDMKRVDFRSIYVNMLEQNKPAIRRIFDRFADPEQYPILIHCTQGKDRTGIVVALLLLMLDVPKYTVIEDYLLTDQLIDIHARLAEMAGYLSEYAGSVPDGITTNDWAPFFKCLPDSIEFWFTHLEAAYGGATGYLHSIGVTSEQQKSIHAILVENPTT